MLQKNADQIIMNDSKGNDEEQQNSNRCFNIFPSIFRKRYSKYKTSCRLGRKHYSFDSLNANDNLSSMPFPITEKCLIPGSPISPRVKNFNLDMKILVLSRNDNPYLSKQIERTNSLTPGDYDQEYHFVEASTPIFSRRSRQSSRNSYSSSSNNRQFSHFFFNEPEDQKNLHEQLVRSPPPNFPEKLSHFLFNENLINEQIENLNLQQQN